MAAAQSEKDETVKFTTRQLFGGAITVDLPERYLDSSFLRQVPDHQEVYLSDTLLTNVVFEINQYVDRTTAGSATITAENHEEISEHSSDDETAILYHLQDLIDDSDAYKIVSKPVKANLQPNSMKRFFAVVTSARVTAEEKDKEAASALPPGWQSNPPMITVNTTIMLLLIRLEKYQTDVLVQVNVPAKEFKTEDDEAKEVRKAEAILERILQTIDIKNFDLFGGE